MIRAILNVENSDDVAQNLEKLRSASVFWKCYDQLCAKIINSDNTYYINNSDKKNLIKKRNPLERNMLQYLLFYDPELLQLKNNEKRVKILIRQFFVSFGLI
jgi:hypothetical protein